MEFRKDINGLRAIAVALVVLFHFGIPGMQGGFIGVDVFFVISGYLMTGIIFSRMRKEKFTTLGFYLDRARRIVPALAFVCLAVLLVGWVLLLPSYYEDLGRQVLGSLVFVSNFIYSQESGYFEQAVHEKWLLHTWSLSVEWQFYLIYPLAIVVLKRFVSLDKIRWFILVAAILSFALSIYASGRWPTHAFYLLPTRAWEMMVGALVFLFTIRIGYLGERGWELVGIGLIVFSAVFIDSLVAWPGWMASLPVLGTALIIIQSRQNSLVTANSVSQFLGKTSYSIYLWHWPIVVWINYFGLGKQPLWVVLGISASVLFGYLSYTFVENIARKRKVAPARNADSPLLNIGIPTSLATALGTVIVLSHGFPHRMSDEFYATMERLDLPRATNGWCFYDVNTDESLVIGDDGLKCTLGDKESSLKGLLFGDSFAGHYEPFWDRIGKEISAEINAVTTNWCYPSTDEVIYGDSSSRSYDQCLVNRKYFFDNASSYDFVVLSGSWWKIDRAGQIKGVFDAISYAASQSKLVIVMAAPTYFDVNVRDMYARSVMFDMDFDVNRFSKGDDAEAVKVNQTIRKYVSQFSNVLYIGRSSLFHVNGVPSEVTEENIPYNYDQHGHISIYGSLMAADSFKESSNFPELSNRMAEIRKRKNIELALMRDIGSKEFKASVPR